MLTTREVIKTFYNALLQRLKKYRGNWEQNDPTADDYIKNRPFYTDETSKETVVSKKTFTTTESDEWCRPFFFKPIIGQVYAVVWDEKLYECIAYEVVGDICNICIGNLNIADDRENNTGEPFFYYYRDNDDYGLYVRSAGVHTIEISTIKVVKLDKKYLPDTIATKSEVETAQATANNAQNTANNAQNIANAAKTAAENAKIDPISYNYCATLFSKYGEFVGWYETMGTLAYEPKSGSFYRSWFETTPLKYEDIPFDEFICTTYLSVGELPYRKYLLFLTKLTFVNGWGIEGVAIDSRGGTFYVKTPTVDKSTGEGLFLDFLPQDYMLINSSTRNSTKKFKITVDDSGKPTFTNLSDSADSYTPTDLPPVTDSDSGKFLRVSSAGEWVAETIPNASGVSF